MLRMKHLSSWKVQWRAKRAGDHVRMHYFIYFRLSCGGNNPICMDDAVCYCSIRGFEHSPVRCNDKLCFSSCICHCLLPLFCSPSAQFWHFKCSVWLSRRLNNCFRKGCGVFAVFIKTCLRFCSWKSWKLCFCQIFLKKKQSTFFLTCKVLTFHSSLRGAFKVRQPMNNFVLSSGWMI